MSSSKREAARAFFGSKKSWSVQKDLILSRYLAAYLKKIVYHMEKQKHWRSKIPPVLIVDAFAGRGWFDDGEHGSPLLIIESADSVATGKYRLLLGNEDPDQHNAVQDLVKEYGHVFVENRLAVDLLKIVRDNVGQRALFVFIDPFGIQGYPFEVIRDLGVRNTSGMSTEILINFNVKDFHKKSARNSVMNLGIDGVDTNTRSKIENLDIALGGGWWRAFQYAPNLSTDKRTDLVVEGYTNRLRDAGYKYIGRCPVREKDEASPKYRLIHGSRHIHALRLMNETMGNVIGDELHKRSVQSDIPLFGEQVGNTDFQNWERRRYNVEADLVEIVLQEVEAQPGERRVEIWHSIIQKHFLQFFHKEYTAVVARLKKAGRIRVKRDDGKNRLSDDSRLYPPL